MEHTLIISGFGGQGIILAGRLVAFAAMRAGRRVTFIPAYGAEVRGGASNCTVVISDQPIACPVVGLPECLIALSKAALMRFANKVRPGGVVLFNSDTTGPSDPRPDGPTRICVPAERLAAGLGNIRAANMVMLGAYAALRPILTVQQLAQTLPHVLAPRHHDTINLNTKAMELGQDFVRQLVRSF
ncbi:MAG: 2-oxoacid:acceptor oxidoreductase family protein [Sedimentisphaerales bacterium]|jgi:2-oxoglutarate ferredoxin oxidoreductase subunit gamma|nr:2-oxoacid:acceptor oxidoreductase family protein [Sedimentisphaerales bacterium]